MTLMQLMTYASPFILLCGVSIGSFYYNTLDAIHKWVVWYLAVMLCVDAASRIMGQLGGNNLIVLLVYSLIELVMFIVLYYKCLFKANHNILKVLGAVACLYILYEIVVFWNIDVKSFQPYAKVADNFLVILLALAFFQEKINFFRESKWDNFQLNTIILVFFTISLLIFLPVNFLVNESTGLKFYFWQGVLVITIMFYIYLTHSVWKNGRQGKHLQGKGISSSAQ